MRIINYLFKGHFYPSEARTELKPIITKYKKERVEMYKEYVFAIGDKPDNGSWTGFQNQNLKNHDGHLTVFRELNNNETDKKMALHFLAPGTKTSSNEYFNK